MAITYFASASNPSDNGSLAGPTVAITPPASMQAGDLVLLVCAYKGAVTTMAIGTTGGQEWHPCYRTRGTTAVLTMVVFWARFNGTWEANPTVTIGSGTNAMTAHMHVFRPSNASNKWDVIATNANSDNAASTAMAATAIQVPTGGLIFAAVASDDDNTYTNASGGAFQTAGNLQYRNLQGQDMSTGAQYRIETDASPVAQTAQWTQATLGADPFCTVALGFKEYDSTSQQIAVPVNSSNVNGTFNSTNATLWEAVDEGPDPDLNDYISNPGTFATEAISLNLSTLNRPASMDGIYLHVACLPGTGSAANNRADLYEGTTLIQSNSLASGAIITGQRYFSVPILNSNAQLISDWSNLRVRITASNVVDSRYQNIWLEAPLADTTPPATYTPYSFCFIV